MIRFFNFYEDRNSFNNFLHKSQFISTALMPVLFLFIAAIAFIVYPLAVVLSAAMCVLYALGTFRSLFSARKEGGKFPNPLFLSSISGPLYLGIFISADPALFGIKGLILIFAIPVIILGSLLISALRNRNRSDDEDYDDLEDEVSQDNVQDNTEEIRTVS